MRLTVKNYKRVEWASEETDCFTATLYLDGKKIGTARNDGHGGGDFYDFVSKQAQADFDEATNEWVETVKDDPKWQLDDGTSFAGQETFVGEACMNYRREREMKRALKKCATVVRFERPEGWMTAIVTYFLPQAAEVDDLIAKEGKEGDAVYIMDESGMTSRAI
jgi:hypothetical protein